METRKKGASVRCIGLLASRSVAGSRLALPRSSLTAVDQSSFSLVERRQLPSPALGTNASPGRRQVILIFNPHVVMPYRRHLGSSAACSRLPIRSGLVPDDIEVGHVVLQMRCGGEGVVLDFFPFFTRGSLCKFWGLVCNFLFFRGPFCKIFNEALVPSRPIPC